jgi:hypothetical protein
MSLEVRGLVTTVASALVMFTLGGSSGEVCGVEAASGSDSQALQCMHHHICVCVFWRRWGLWTGGGACVPHR